jgi:hypothetical protein
MGALNGAIIEVCIYISIYVYMYVFVCIGVYIHVKFSKGALDRYVYVFFEYT